MSAEPENDVKNTKKTIVSFTIVQCHFATFAKRGNHYEYSYLEHPEGIPVKDLNLWIFCKRVLKSLRKRQIS